MDGQMRLVALVVGLVFLIGTATLVVSSNVFNYKPFDASRALTQDAELSDSTARRQQGRRTSRLQVSESDAESLTARTRVVRLENQLQQRTNELNERNTRIDDLNTQLRALRSTPSRESRATSWETVNLDNLSYILSSSEYKNKTPLKFYLLRDQQVLFGHLAAEPGS